MNTATLSPGSGLVAGWAVRTGLDLAGWGLRRATRRTDRELQLSRLEARATAEAALAARDELIRRAGYLPL
ncbi:hypothetical protein BCL57_002640 [Agromyces flavus]|uniref:Uncharacterized protein n=1 Tax=Agromyces flavus TaxID=589382 RepID=A0A1H1T9X7_9MICO|nr:hypothetical protein [Agromyces flavus]MCP2368467.1 hypothetical protein [Agromyces flavus]GGI47927.1 hypothetical protein GCM10010932_26150 [Agromyces flavus]SDS56826.1 hypothetical protein SAMN04489721_1534 [Agromyces flavus]